HLVAGAVERARVVRRPLRVAERHLVGRVARPDEERKADLEQLVRLVPVDRRVELESPGAGVQADDLQHAARLAERALEGDLRTEGRLCDDAMALRRLRVP